MDDVNESKGKRARLKAVPKPDSEVIVDAPKPRSWSAAKIQNDIVNHIDALSKAGCLETAYPDIFGVHRIMRVEPKDPDTIYRVEENKEVTVVPLHDFEILMHAFFRVLFKIRYGGQALDISSQARTARLLASYIPRLSPDEVKIFAYPSEPELYCWKRMPFNILKGESLIAASEQSQTLYDDGPAPTEIDFSWIDRELSFHCPAWSGILQRAGNRHALLAWFGSLFIRELSNPQFVYMYGEGGDSKGTIVQTLQRIFGRKLYHTQNIPDKNSGALRFFTSSLEGKLLLICPDADTKSLFTQFLKTLTGGDDLVVEPKNEKTRNVKNHIRLFYVSNDRPIIPDKDYAKRRIILVPMKPIAGPPIEGYEETLVDEAQIFFSLCRLAYDLMPNKIRFEQDQLVYRTNIEKLNEDLIDLIEAYFIVTDMQKYADPSNKTPVKDQPHMEVHEFDRYVKDHFKGYKTPEVRDLLHSLYGVSRDSKMVSLTHRKKVRCLMGVEPIYPNLPIPRAT